jgi:hypothetical protein
MSLMMMTNPITPPPELVKQWASEFYGTTIAPGEAAIYVATQAAQWGADQELDACCDTLQRHAHWDLAVFELIADRRPKRPNLKQQALKSLEGMALPEDAFETIRRALEALDD